MTDLAKLVVRLETENAKLVEGLQKATREVDRFRKDAESAADRVGSAFKNLAAIGLSAVSITAVATSIKQIVDRADDFDDFSEKVGVGVKALSALDYAAGLTGVSTEQLMNGLKRLSANVADTAAGVGDAKDAFKALGVDVRDANGNIKSSDALLKEIADKFAGAEDGVNKTAIAMKLFGKAGADLIPMLNEGSEGLARMGEEGERFGKVITEETAQAAETFNKNLSRLTDALSAPFRTAVQDALPAVAQITDAMVLAAKEGGILTAVMVGLGGAIKAAFTDEFDTNIEKLTDLRIKLSELQRRLKEKTGQGLLHDWIYGDDLDIQEEIDKTVAEMSALKDKIDAATKSTGNVGAAAESAKGQLADLTKETKGLSEGQKAGNKEQDAYLARLAKLIGELDPVALKTQEYMQAVADLDKAWVDGLISGEEYDQKIMELATDKEALKKQTEDLAKSEKEAAKEREELAKKNQELLLEPFKNAIEGIQSVVTDTFESIFDGSIRNAGDAADAIKRIFIRMAAELATLKLFNPQVSFGSLLGGAGLFGSGTATAGGQLAAGSTPGLSINPLSAFSNFLGPAGSLLGIGALGGGLIGKLTGGNTLGSSIGGALGAYGGVLAGSGVLGGATGALVGTLGQLGNFVIPGLGLALGALAGGLIGKKKPSNASAFGILDLGSGSRLQAPAERNSTDATRGARDAIVDAVLKLREGVVAATGGRITGRIGLDVGQRDGVQVSGIGAGRYGDPQTAVAAIFRAMTDNLQGVDAQFRQVFARLDLSNLDQAVADMGMAATIINRDYIAAEPLTEAYKAVNTIVDAFKPLIDGAQRLGLALQPIVDEQHRQIRELAAGFNAEIDRMILGITDPLAAAIADFDRVAADRLSNARTLGADLVDVERLNALERARIVEQYGQQANGALFQANQSIEQFLTGLRTGGAYLSPAATLANAESEFSRLLGLAQGGDVAARGSLSGAAGALLNASREAWGSSEMFFQRLNFVESSLGNLIGQGSGTTMFDNLGVTIAQGNSSLEYQLVQLNNKVAELTAVVADQQASLARLAAA